MAEAWFQVERVPEPGEAAVLPRDEARHALGSRRLGPGDAVTLFDGRGRIGRARIGSRLRDGSVPVEVLGVEMPARPEPLVHLRAALPKGDRQSALLDHAGQLGVASFAPLRCARSVAHGGPSGKDDRFRRILAEACKQARCPWIPELGPEVAFADALASFRAAGIPIAIAHPATGDEALPRGPAVALLVGPEGGFTGEELAAARAAGAIPLDLGPTILRTELAAAVGASLLRRDGPKSVS